MQVNERAASVITLPCEKRPTIYVTLLSSLPGAIKEIVLIVTKEVIVLIVTKEVDRAFEDTSYRPQGFCMVSLTLQGSEQNQMLGGDIYSVTKFYQDHL